MVTDILKHIYRHDEPYVDEFLTAAAGANGVTKPRSYEERAHDVCRDLASGLALWTVVDSFTLGLLGRFVMSCDRDEEGPVWKAVAESFEIKAKVFESRVKSLAYLRNAVAHHARLWMRPT